MADDKIWISCPGLENSQSNIICSIFDIFSCEISIILYCFGHHNCVCSCVVLGRFQYWIPESFLSNSFGFFEMLFMLEHCPHIPSVLSPSPWKICWTCSPNHKVLYVLIPFAFSLKEYIDHILYFMLSAVYFKCLFSSVSVQLYFGLSSWVNLKLWEALLWSEMATGK